MESESDTHPDTDPEGEEQEYLDDFRVQEYESSSAEEEEGDPAGNQGNESKGDKEDI